MGNRARGRLVTATVLLAACLPFVAQLLHGDLVRGHDHLSYVPRLVELHENVRAGILLPRWAPDLGSGHGQPLFLFAPPLLYWLAEAWHLAGFDPAWSMNLATAVVVVASALAMHRLAAPRLGAAGGRLAAVAYLLVPYFSVDLFVRQALAELAAFPLFPLILDGLLRHEATGRRRMLAQAAVAWAALSCTHPPSALLFAPVPAALAAFLALRRGSLALLLRQAAAIAVGMLLSAFAWLPALLEKRHVWIERLLEHESLRWDQHFVHPMQLIVSPWGQGLSVAGPGDGLSFELGRVHLILAAAVLVLAWRRRDALPDRGLLAAATVLILAGCVMMTHVSEPIWAAVATLQYVQFQWRLLAVTAVPLAFLTGAFAPACLARGRGGRVALVAGIVALVAVNLPHVRVLGRDAFDPAWWTPEALARRGASVTTAEEYEPRVVEQPQPWSAERIVTSPGIRVLAEEHGPESARATIRADAAGEVWLRSYAYPGWEVSVDGRRVSHRVASPSGFLVADVDPGAREVTFVLRRTPVQKAGLALSACGVAGLLALLGPVRRRPPA